MMIH
jgi:hypothetical protein